MPCKKEKVTERGYDTEKNKNTENKVSQKGEQLTGPPVQPITFDDSAPALTNNVKKH